MAQQILQINNQKIEQDIIEELRPYIGQLLSEAPAFGHIAVEMTFASNKLMRIETKIEKSKLYNQEIRR
jgi:hypothetical protein